MLRSGVYGQRIAAMVRSAREGVRHAHYLVVFEGLSRFKREI